MKLICPSSPIDVYFADRCLYRSHNEITFLTGIPGTIRTLLINNNMLTSLVSFKHILNLERLDLSNNQLDSLDRKFHSIISEYQLSNLLSIVLSGTSARTESRQQSNHKYRRPIQNRWTNQIEYEGQSSFIGRLFLH